jgi:hypothetical protein
MLLFLFRRGILPVPINNYSNVIKVTKFVNTRPSCLFSLWLFLFFFILLFNSHTTILLSMLSLLRYTQPQSTVHHHQFLVYGDAQWYNTIIIKFSQRPSVHNNHNEKRQVVQINSNCIKRYRWKRIKRHVMCCIAPIFGFILELLDYWVCRKLRYLKRIFKWYINISG